MGRPDMDRLIHDIQDFLRAESAEDAKVVRSVPMGEEAVLEGELLEVTGGAEEGGGGFLPSGDPEVLRRVGRLAQAGSYAIQGVAIGALMIAVSMAWPSALHLTLAILTILGGGIVGVIALLGVHARIALLLEIESNTRRIAGNKQRIAAMLERIWIV